MIKYFNIISEFEKKSKDYNKFRYYNETEKLNFMLDFYFYIMDLANLNEEENMIIENNEIENENENDEAVDKLIEAYLPLSVHHAVRIYGPHAVC